MASSPCASSAVEHARLMLQELDGEVVARCNAATAHGVNTKPILSLYRTLSTLRTQAEVYECELDDARAYMMHKTLCRFFLHIVCAHNSFRATAYSKERIQFTRLCNEALARAETLHAKLAQEYENDFNDQQRQMEQQAAAARQAQEDARLAAKREEQQRAEYAAAEALAQSFKNLSASPPLASPSPSSLVANAAPAAAAVASPAAPSSVPPSIPYPSIEPAPAPPASLSKPAASGQPFSTFAARPSTQQQQQQQQQRWPPPPPPPPQPVVSQPPPSQQLVPAPAHQSFQQLPYAAGPLQGQSSSLQHGSFAALPTPSAPEFAPPVSLVPPAKPPAPAPVPAPARVRSLPALTTTLRTVHLPSNVLADFHTLALANTDANIETCGILCGRFGPPSGPAGSGSGTGAGGGPSAGQQQDLWITHVILPGQSGTADTCVTSDEERLIDVQVELDLLSCGWIHTHPRQTCFLSSVDLHTHFSYQVMLAESLAVVLAPTKQPDAGVFHCTLAGMRALATCPRTGFHKHEESFPLYEPARHHRWEADPRHRATFVDLRTKAPAAAAANGQHAPQPHSHPHPHHHPAQQAHRH